MRSYRVVVLVATAFVVGGCGGGAVQVDAGRDAAAQPDAAPLDAGVPDAPMCPLCAAPVPVCDVGSGRCVQCLAAADCATTPFTPVCNPSTHGCQECETTADCAANPGALGPTCVTPIGYCQCGGPDGGPGGGVGDCSLNPNGVVCDPDVHACTCLTDGDCPAPLATCQPLPYLGAGKKTCQ